MPPVPGAGRLGWPRQRLHTTMSSDPIISATRLRRFIMCRRQPYMDVYGPLDERVEPAALRWLHDLGIRHEEEVARTRGYSAVPRGAAEAAGAYATEDRELDQRVAGSSRRRTSYVIPSGATALEVAGETHRIMKEGFEGVRSGLLVVDNWWGSPDWLRKSKGRSALGPWHYYPIDAKATTKMPRRAHIVPTVFYALQLERIQGVRPEIVVENRLERVEIETRPHVVETLQTIRKLERMLSHAEDPGPDLGSKCEKCSWRKVCHRNAVATNHLSLLPDTLPATRRVLLESGYKDVRALAAAQPADLTRIPHLRKLASRLVVQARSLDDGRIRFVSPDLLPQRSAVEAFIDFEAVPMLDAQPIVLYGVLITQGRNVRYEHALARELSRRELEIALRGFLSILADLGSDVPIFHWGNYEKGALRRQGFSEATALAERTVDLHQVVRKAAVLPLRSRNIKELGVSLGLHRTSDIETGLRAGDLWQQWRHDRNKNDLRELLKYNRDDLRLLAGTLRLLRAARDRPADPPVVARPKRRKP